MTDPQGRGGGEGVLGYIVANTHRMPKVAGHVLQKEPLIIGFFCPKGAFRRKMTYEDKAPYASASACMLVLYRRGSERERRDV